MIKPSILVLLTAALLAGCGQYTRIGTPLKTRVLAPVAEGQDRRPPGPVQSAMDDFTYMKMVDLDGNNKLTFDEFKLLGVFPALTYGLAVRPVQPTLEDLQTRAFHDYDDNDDQLLSKTEFKELGATISGWIGYKGMEEVLLLVDADENGVMSAKEWKMLGIFGVNRRARDEAGARSLVAWQNDTFALLDSNHDNKLSDKEQRAVWKTMWYDGKPWLL